jgi:hypothetical protein
MKQLMCAVLVLLSVSIIATAQTTNKLFEKDGLSFEYAAGWSVTDDSTSDAQQINLARADSDLSIGVFAHKGKISPDKFADAKKSFIDPYVAARVKQFVQMGLKPEQSPIAAEIGGVKADGTRISAVLGGDPGGASIYWALVGQRVVILTLFGPDSDAKKLAASWDLVRTSLKLVDPKAAATPKP